MFPNLLPISNNFTEVKEAEIFVQVGDLEGPQKSLKKPNRPILGIFLIKLYFWTPSGLRMTENQEFLKLYLINKKVYFMTLGPLGQYLARGSVKFSEFWIFFYP